MAPPKKKEEKVEAAAPKKSPAAKSPAAKKVATPKKATPKKGAKLPTTAAGATLKPVAAAGEVQITSSKACKAFATRADSVKEAVLKAKAGVKVEIDEQKAEGKKPDRGSFVIVANGKIIVELRGMVRPFAQMKDLDMDVVAQKVIAALK